MSGGHIFQPPDPPGSPIEKLLVPKKDRALWKLQRKLRNSGLDPKVADNLVDAFTEYETERQYEDMKNFESLEYWANRHTHAGGAGGIPPGMEPTAYLGMTREGSHTTTTYNWAVVSYMWIPLKETSLINCEFQLDLDLKNGGEVRVSFHADKDPEALQNPPGPGTLLTEGTTWVTDATPLDGPRFGGQVIDWASIVEVELTKRYWLTFAIPQYGLDPHEDNDYYGTVRPYNSSTSDINGATEVFNLEHDNSEISTESYRCVIRSHNNARLSSHEPENIETYSGTSGFYPRFFMNSGIPGLDEGT